MFCKFELLADYCQKQERFITGDFSVTILKQKWNLLIITVGSGRITVRTAIWATFGFVQEHYSSCFKRDWFTLLVARAEWLVVVDMSNCGSGCSLQNHVADSWASQCIIFCSYSSDWCSLTLNDITSVFRKKTALLSRVISRWNKPARCYRMCFHPSLRPLPILSKNFR